MWIFILFYQTFFFITGYIIGRVAEENHREDLKNFKAVCDDIGME
jgi:hypothetical protein